MWKLNIKRPAHWIYLILLCKLPAPCPKLILTNNSNSLQYLANNWNRPLPKGPKQNLLLFLFKAWGHWTRMSHIVPGLSRKCRFGCDTDEDQQHLLTCPNTIQILEELHRIFRGHPVSRRNIPYIYWPNLLDDLLCQNKQHSTPNIILWLYIISAIRAAIIARHAFAGSHPTIPATLLFTSNLLNLFHETKHYRTPIAGVREVVKPTSLPPPDSPHDAIINLDGSYDIPHGKMGAGTSITVDNIEVAAFIETIPFGSINVAEYQALVNGKIMAYERGYRKIHIQSDSELVLKLESGKAMCHAPEVPLVFSQSMQLNKHFETITYKKIPRSENNQADQWILPEASASVFHSTFGAICLNIFQFHHIR